MAGGKTAALHAQHLESEKDLLIERLKQEVIATKQQLVEQNEELIQLRSSHLKLQDMLKKKDKDLQQVFAILREGNTTGAAKKRKEITDRLVNELQQKAHNAEALALARKQALDELNKALRLQELQVQAQEYFKEVGRLRQELAKRAHEPAVAETPSPRRELTDQATDQTTHRPPVVAPAPPVAVPPPEVKVAVAPSKFVSKKKQAIIEAEYRRQCRIAELAAHKLPKLDLHLTSPQLYRR
ncbi:hypothetical protein ACHHYP_00216 [Achlya hypogyna]|uniref:Uncharacterized protein n=1 Tax=Achlya hypogyna TaxID=1202772 RepID=A0A1V9ZB47_ACHHY|nr:hypothetical protein ACHHYP_00216 [Achlya hypogyna]